MLMICIVVKNNQYQIPTNNCNNRQQVFDIKGLCSFNLQFE